MVRAAPIYFRFGGQRQTAARLHPATVAALPGLLMELKQRGFRIVQVVPASGAEP
jgi:hypothetical protein